MKFLKYVSIYCFRSKRKFSFTFFSVVIALSLFCLMEYFARSAKYDVDETRIIISNDVSLAWGLPVSYRDRIVENVKGAEKITYFHVGYGSRSPNLPPLIIISIDKNSYFDVVPELKVAPEQIQQFKTWENGCLVGSSLAARRSWKAGDLVSLEDPVSGNNFDFKVCGIYHAKKPEENEYIYCGYSYHEKVTPRMSGKVLNLLVKVDPGQDMSKIAGDIDKYFASDSPPTRSLPERVFASNVQATYGNFVLIFRAIGAAVLLATLMVTVNTFIMGVREQTVTLSTLRLLGYSKAKVRFLVMSESLFTCLFAGFFVVAVALYFNTGVQIACQSLFLSLVLGVLSGLIPAIIAGKGDLAGALRKIV